MIHVPFCIILFYFIPQYAITCSPVDSGLLPGNNLIDFAAFLPLVHSQQFVHRNAEQFRKQRFSLLFTFTIEMIAGIRAMTLLFCGWK